MTERVARLRQQSLEARPVLSTERAELLTEFYRQNTALMSAPVRRARAFQYLMEHKTIYIGEGELIVGEKGPAPKATPTYPELCCHSLKDLDILNSREKIPFIVTPEARRVYEETIIPFWRGKTMREYLPGDDRRVESGLRGRYFHRVHGTALAWPHRPRRQNLPQGDARL